MKLLLIETEPGIAFAIEDQLVSDGHEVVQCNDGLGGPCKGVADHRHCPLHSHIDLAILARPEVADRTLNEMGSVCARQHRIPIVHVDPCEPDSILADLDGTAATARHRVEEACAAAVRRELRRAGVEHDPEVDVQRTRDRIGATIHLSREFASPTQQNTMSDRARHAIRTHDPFVRVIDVSVVIDR